MEVEDLLVLVNEYDEVIGSGAKLEVHRRKLLHRAFSIFLYDQRTDSLLLQKRAFGKYHSGGKWSNSCCSHPRWGEAYPVALARRLKEELGIAIPEEQAWIINCSSSPDPLLFPEVSLSLPSPTGPEAFRYCGRFLYFADYGELAEHEIDRVFWLPFDREKDSFTANPQEIADCRWLPRADIRRLLTADPTSFSAWFARAFALLEQSLDRTNVKTI